MDRLGHSELKLVRAIVDDSQTYDKSPGKKQRRQSISLRFIKCFTNFIYDNEYLIVLVQVFLVPRLIF